MTDKEYKELSVKEFSKAAKVYETDDAGVYKMCKKDYPDILAELEIPLINLKGHGDVHVYGKDEVKELCDNSGLIMESFEKRDFFRLYAVARKPA
ncbi:MAG: hypothetical protein J5685_11895 [Clostridiales bacterium]|nr:hypothetical protein [Clostridiales bacterium]